MADPLILSVNCLSPADVLSPDVCHLSRRKSLTILTASLLNFVNFGDQISQRNLQKQIFTRIVWQSVNSSWEQREKESELLICSHYCHTVVDTATQSRQTQQQRADRHSNTKQTDTAIRNRHSNTEQTQQHRADTATQSRQTQQYRTDTATQSRRTQQHRTDRHSITEQTDTAIQNRETQQYRTDRHSNTEQTDTAIQNRQTQQYRTDRHSNT
jgi:hypothetical protein